MEPSTTSSPKRSGSSRNNWSRSRTDGAWWLGLAWVRHGRWPGITDALVRDWARGSWPLTHLDPIWAFLQVSLVAIPAGLGLAALAWSWRNYAMSSGIGGWLASAPITFDARQWKRQVGRAGEVNKAPGAVPLLARGTLIPVGGTIQTIGHRWRSVWPAKERYTAATSPLNCPGPGSRCRAGRGNNHAQAHRCLVAATAGILLVLPAATARAATIGPEITWSGVTASPTGSGATCQVASQTVTFKVTGLTGNTKAVWKVTAFGETGGAIVVTLPLGTVTKADDGTT